MYDIATIAVTNFGKDLVILTFWLLTLQNVLTLWRFVFFCSWQLYRPIFSQLLQIYSASSCCSHCCSTTKQENLKEFYNLTLCTGMTSSFLIATEVCVFYYYQLIFINFLLIKSIVYLHSQMIPAQIYNNKNV